MSSVVSNDINAVYIEGLDASFESIVETSVWLAVGMITAWLICSPMTFVDTAWAMGLTSFAMTPIAVMIRTTIQIHRTINTPVMGATSLPTAADDRIRGNIFHDRDWTIESIELYAGVDSGCRLDFYLMEVSSLTLVGSQTWNVVEQIERRTFDYEQYPRRHIADDVGYPGKGRYYGIWWDGIAPRQVTTWNIITVRHPP